MTQRRNPRSHAGARPAAIKAPPLGEGATDQPEGEDEERIVVQLRTSRIRDTNHKRIARGRIVSMPVTRAVDLAGKGFVTDPPAKYDPTEVIEL